MKNGTCIRVFLTPYLMSGQLVRLRVHNMHFELPPYYQGVHKSKVFTWPELTLLGGFHFRGGDTPSLGLDRDIALYRVWFSGS